MRKVICVRVWLCVCGEHMCGYIQYTITTCLMRCKGKAWFGIFFEIRWVFVWYGRMWTIPQFDISDFNNDLESIVSSNYFKNSINSINGICCLKIHLCLMALYIVKTGISIISRYFNCIESDSFIKRICVAIAPVRDLLSHIRNSFEKYTHFWRPLPMNVI